MNTVRYFKLHNSGGFVARLCVDHRRDDEQNWSVWKPSGYADICAGAERTVDLKGTGIEDGSHVRLFAFVAGGADKTAGEEYIFDPNASGMAAYEISGTTLNNSLKLKSYG